MGIRDAQIEIGDKKKGEKPVTIQGPLFVPSHSHSLVLYPINHNRPLPKPHKVSGDIYESESESESDASSDSGN
jgi:hypothetical protein